METDEKDSNSLASSSGTTKVTDHFSTLEKIKSSHAEPSSNKAQELSIFVIKKKEDDTAGLDTIANHFTLVG